MKLAPLRWLLLTAALFVAWISWLAYLALTAGHPVVLSRAQFLTSTLDVIAQVEQAEDGQPKSDVKVLEVVWPPDQQDLVGRTLQVMNLPTVTNRNGWNGPGRYILPLVREGSTYRVAGTPRSPGFESTGKVRIYPDTPETRAQLQQIEDRRQGR